MKFSVENIGECVVQWTPTLINCLSFHPYIDSDVLPMSFLSNYLIIYSSIYQLYHYILTLHSSIIM